MPYVADLGGSQLLRSGITLLCSLLPNVGLYSRCILPDAGQLRIRATECIADIKTPHAESNKDRVPMAEYVYKETSDQSSTFSSWTEWMLCQLLSFVSSTSLSTKYFLLAVTSVIWPGIVTNSSVYDQSIRRYPTRTCICSRLELTIATMSFSAFRTFSITSYKQLWTYLFVWFSAVIVARPIDFLNASPSSDVYIAYRILNSPLCPDYISSPVTSSTSNNRHSRLLSSSHVQMYSYTRSSSS